MTAYQLEAQKRTDTGSRLVALRAKGLVPAILYGKGKENINLAVEKNAFNRIFRQTGETSLLELAIAGESQPHNVLIHDLQNDPVSDEPIHADFYEVRMDEEIETEVPLVFIGEAPAVKDLEGTLITNKTAVAVKCLPANIPHEITVNIAKLATFEDSIKVSDLQIPANIELLTDPEETIAIVNPPRSEEELAALEEKVEENVEAVGEAIEKKPEEEAEGEAPAQEKKEEKKE